MSVNLQRWAIHGEKPAYAGLLTFGDTPYIEEASELAGIDIAVVGVPMDDLVSERPGARFGPRAIRAAGRPSGPHLEAGVDAFEVLRIVDYGDAPVLPGDPSASHAAALCTVSEVATAGVLPIILGGDHSTTEPSVTAAAQGAEVGLIHFDAHADTFPSVLGAEISHGTVVYRLVEAGVVTPQRYAQIGGRGYSPPPEVLEWQRQMKVRAFPMADIRSRGIEAVIDEALAAIGGGPTFMTIDVDVLDPAFAPGTGSPEPGGLHSADLLWAVRTCAERAELIGADVVEVLPTAPPAGPDVTALVADRLVREVLTGVALRRLAENPAPAGAG